MVEIFVQCVRLNGRRNLDAQISVTDLRVMSLEEGGSGVETEGYRISFVSPSLPKNWGEIEKLFSRLINEVLERFLVTEFRRFQEIYKIIQDCLRFVACYFRFWDFFSACRLEFSIFVFP